MTCHNRFKRESFVRLQIGGVGIETSTGLDFVKGGRELHSWAKKSTAGKSLHPYVQAGGQAHLHSANLDTGAWSTTMLCQRWSGVVDDFIAGGSEWFRHTRTVAAHRGLALANVGTRRLPSPLLTQWQRTNSSLFCSHRSTTRCKGWGWGASLKIVIVVVVVVVTTPTPLLPIHFIVLTSEKKQCV